VRRFSRRRSRVPLAPPLWVAVTLSVDVDRTDQDLSRQSDVILAESVGCGSRARHSSRHGIYQTVIGQERFARISVGHPQEPQQLRFLRRQCWVSVPKDARNTFHAGLLTLSKKLNSALRGSSVHRARPYQGVANRCCAGPWAARTYHPFTHSRKMAANSEWLLSNSELQWLCSEHQFDQLQSVELGQKLRRTCQRKQLKQIPRGSCGPPLLVDQVDTPTHLL